MGRKTFWRGRFQWFIEMVYRHSCSKTTNKIGSTKRIKLLTIIDKEEIDVALELISIHNKYLKNPSELNILKSQWKELKRRRLSNTIQPREENIQKSKIQFCLKEIVLDIY